MVNQCTGNKPLMIYVAPGTHVTINCPIHPKGHVIMGGSKVELSRSITASSSSIYLLPYSTQTAAVFDDYSGLF